LEGEASADRLLEQLAEAEALAMWLRDNVRLELEPADAALFQSLLQRAVRKGPLEFNSAGMDDATMRA
jgi:hypothetical protein